MQEIGCNLGIDLGFKNPSALSQHACYLSSCLWVLWGQRALKTNKQKKGQIINIYLYINIKTSGLEGSCILTLPPGSLQGVGAGAPRTALVLDRPEPAGPRRGQELEVERRAGGESGGGSMLAR